MTVAKRQKVLNHLLFLPLLLLLLRDIMIEIMKSVDLINASSNHHSLPHSKNHNDDYSGATGG